MAPTKRMGVALGVAAAAGALVLGGASLASADSSPAPSATSGTEGARPAGSTGAGPRGGSQDTPVTGDEATKVGAAVTAKDSAVTVTSVRKDPDGSYDVLGTKAGAPVFFEVSADLKTVTQNTRTPGQGKGGHGPQGQAPSGGAGTPQATPSVGAAA